MKRLALVLFLLDLFFLSSAKCRTVKDVAYRSPSDKNFDKKGSLLDVYIPTKQEETSKEVLLFVHGGNWIHGKKETYKFFGKRLADKGIIAIIVNYRLGPLVDYHTMASDVASATAWAYEHISEYGGDKNKIVISGHSAGGHLAALVATDDAYFKELKIENPIQGCVAIDAFGLDMFHYFPTSHYKLDATYKQMFSNDPETWKKASPLFHLDSNTVPHLLLLGEKTYPGIKRQMRAYEATLIKEEVRTSLYVVPKRHHIGMIFQFYRKKDKCYPILLDFMDTCWKDLEVN